MKFVSANIHFQNSSKSLTFRIPSFIFRGFGILKVLVVVGFVLFLVQVFATNVHDIIHRHMVSERVSLDKEMSKIEGSLEYLFQTSSNFVKDEKRIHSKFGLALVDEGAREMGTGGFVSPEVLLERNASPLLEHLSSLKENVSRVGNKIEYSGQSFVSLSEYIAQQQSRWRYIPSIAPTRGRVGSGFGPRVHPVTGELGKVHQGVDLSNERWTPIYATADGVVEISQYSNSFGNYVAVNHGNGLKTRYGHMQMSIVQPGQLVRRYQILGYMGSTGRSTGPHLHYEVWVGNHPVNPVAYILPGDYSVD